MRSASASRSALDFAPAVAGRSRLRRCRRFHSMSSRRPSVMLMTPAGGPARSIWAPTTTLVTAISQRLRVSTDAASKTVPVVRNTIPMLVLSSRPRVRGLVVLGGRRSLGLKERRQFPDVGDDHRAVREYLAGPQPAGTDGPARPASRAGPGRLRRSPGGRPRTAPGRPGSQRRRALAGRRLGSASLRRGGRRGSRR